MNNSMLGDLASQIMAGQDPIAQPAPAGMPENSTDPLIVETHSSLDISEVEVSSDLMDQILGTSTTTNKIELTESTTTSECLVDEALKDFIEEEDAQEAEDLHSLIQEVRDLLVSVKGVLTEMTTVGQIGVNMGAGPGKKKKGDALTEPGEDSAKDVDPMQKLLRRVKARRAKL